jgi:hypothetical protein
MNCPPVDGTALDAVEGLMMPQSTPCAVLTLLLMSAGMMLGVAEDSRAQNFSGLNGQELQLKRDSETDLGVMLGGLLNKDAKISGNITKVIVKNDSERQLVVTVSSAQLDNKIVWGELYDQDGKRQPQFLTNSMVVPAGSAPVDLIFNLDERLGKDAKLESAALRLYAANSSKASPGLVRTYPIAKKWQMEIRPENLVTVIAPQPIEEAAELTERVATTVVPSKTLTPQIMRRDAAVLRPQIIMRDHR